MARYFFKLILLAYDIQNTMLQEMLKLAQRQCETRESRLSPLIDRIRWRTAPTAPRGPSRTRSTSDNEVTEGREWMSVTRDTCWLVKSDQISPKKTNEESQETGKMVISGREGETESHAFVVVHVGWCCGGWQEFRGPPSCKKIFCMIWHKLRGCPSGRKSCFLSRKGIIVMDSLSSCRRHQLLPSS